MAFYLAAGHTTPTNSSLVAALRRLGVHAEIVGAVEVAARARPGDVVLGRLDILPTLDGVEAGLWSLRRLRGRGVTVLNGADVLLSTHDKLATALRLARYGLPHPRTSYVDYNSVLPSIEAPVVVKPRFGSWGRDVALCRDRDELVDWVSRLSDRGWFRRQGVLVQELIRPRGYDLRVLVAAGEAVGAIERIAAPGEWRTNVALGATRKSVVPPPEACAVAVAAAAAVHADLVGVDLLPAPGGGWVVLELNGAVDFTAEYSWPAADVFEDVARALALSEAEPISLESLA